MDQREKDYYQSTLEYSMEMQAQIADLRAKLDSGSLEELADLLFAADRTLKQLEDTIKHARSLKSASEKVLCMKWMVVSDGGNVKTEYTTATPTITEMPKLPSRSQDPDRYKQLLMSLGCPEHLVDNNCLAPYWPGLVQHVEQLHADGKPLPEGCDPSKTYPVYKVKLFKKKGPLDNG